MRFYLALCPQACSPRIRNFPRPRADDLQWSQVSSRSYAVPISPFPSGTKTIDQTPSGPFTRSSRRFLTSEPGRERNMRNGECACGNRDGRCTEGGDGRRVKVYLQDHQYECQACISRCIPSVDTQRRGHVERCNVICHDSFQIGHCLETCFLKSSQLSASADQAADRVLASISNMVLEQSPVIQDQWRWIRRINIR